MHLEVTLTDWFQSPNLADYTEAQRIIRRQLRAELGYLPQIILVSDEGEEDTEALAKRMERFMDDEYQPGR